MWDIEYILAIPLLLAAAWTIGIIVWAILSVIWEWVSWLL